MTNVPKAVEETLKEWRPDKSTIEGLEEENERLYRDWKFTAGLVDSLQALLKQAHSIIADGIRENNELRAIIALMDKYAPLADETCDEPGITLSEAVRREMKEQK